MKYILVLFFLILNTCCTQIPILKVSIEGRVSISDPDPMCHFKYSESNEELLEKLLSADPFDLYDDDSEVEVPYKVIVEPQQRLLPKERYATMACLRRN